MTTQPTATYLLSSSALTSTAEAAPMPRTRKLRIALAGKGGAGKSAIAGTLARSLALDVDTLPGLAFSLGLPLEEGHVDYLLVMAEPGPKALEVARRAVEMAHERKVAHILVANRIVNEADLEKVRQFFLEEVILVVSEDRAIEDADKQANAPIDVAAGSPGLQAFESLVERLLQPARPNATSKTNPKLQFLDKGKNN